ncbi:sigma-54 interaction domain-containing protein [Clostridiisalibacter paucivorans]|uniref:sigma-54 interaction domain-containing protein n=1 Tax=Clostridiisalibacter paucivorans TaxID=408753 RepID=UPI000B22D55E|nr:sigma-54-dependent Fis family transcriptional regulator [Clostridiisalibacter paucivorans]
MLRLESLEICNVINKNVDYLLLNNTLKDAIIYGLKSKYNNIPIAREDKTLLGILTKEDIEGYLKNVKDLTTPISKFDIKMYSDICVKLDELPTLSYRDFKDEVFVVDNKFKFIGIVKKEDYTNYQLKFWLLSVSSVIDSTDHGIIAIDNNLKVIIYNNSAEKIFGIDKEDALGKHISYVYSDSQLPNIMDTGETYVNDLIMINNRKVLSNKAPIIVDNDVKGAIALFQDVNEHSNLLKELEEQKNVSRILNTILDTIYDGIVVVDKDGYITMISKAYTNFLNVEEKSVVGRHVTDVIENSRMHIVAKTGKSEIANIQKIKGNYMIATRIPMIKNGKTIGAVGKVLFRNINELNELHKKIKIMENELAKYKGEFIQINKAKYIFDNIVGRGKRISETKKMAKKAAMTNSSVLLLGESGTGKELFAHAIHNSSNRSYGPFIRVNCAAIPSELLESELFGYEEGAFTGARKGGKIGKFELADGGTIFLDEIGDMPLLMQAKLLRVIQEREIERIGSNRLKRINVRIIAATNKKLDEKVKNGKFREDLYYRLNVFTIDIPPLRERIEDTNDLCNHFLNELNKKNKKNVKGITERGLKFLTKYNWPGNVRELANVIERAINIVDNEEEIDIKHLPEKILGEKYVLNLGELKEILEKTEREAVFEAIRFTEGNKTKAAKLLGISRTTLYEKLEKFNKENYKK